ncbi:MAG: tetratricopeptide repeat protein [bacterium]
MNDKPTPEAPRNETEIARGVSRNSALWITLLFLLCLLSALVFLGNSLNPFGPVRTFIFRAFCMVFVFVWTWEWLTRRAIAVVRTPLDTPLALLCLWSAASFLYAANPIYALDSFIQLVCGVFIFMVVSRKVHGGGARTLVLLVLIAGAAACVFGYVDFSRRALFIWDALFENRFYSLWAHVKPPLHERLGWPHFFEGRTSSSFGNPVYFAGCLVLLLPACLGFFLSSRRLIERLAAFVILPLLFSNLVMTFTRGAWACAAAGVVFTAVSAGSGETRKILKKNLAWLLPPAAACALFAAAFLTTNPLHQNGFTIAGRIGSLANRGDESALQRALIWKTSLRMALDRPLIGVGFGNYGIFHPVYQKDFLDDPFWKKHYSFADSPHNEYLEMVCERGLPALALFLWFALRLVSMGAGTSRRGGAERPDWLCAGVTGGVAALLLYALVQFPFRIVPVAVHFWLFAGLVAGISARRETARLPAAAERMREKMGTGGAAALMLLAGALLALVIFASSAPVRGHVLAYWGNRAFHLGMEERGLRLLNRALRLASYDQEVLFYAASATLLSAQSESDPLRRAGLMYAARDVLLRARELNPNDTLVLNKLGNVYLFTDDADGAIAQYEKAASLEPDPAGAFYNLGIAYYRKRAYNQAVGAFRKSLSFDPENGLAYYNVAKSLAAADMRSEAVEAFREAIGRDPENPEIFHSLGQAYDRWGDFDRAVSCYRRALALKPDHFDVRGNLAISLINRKNYPDAVEILSSLVEEQPDSAIAFYHLGKAYRGLGDAPRAASSFRRAAELEPGNTAYKDALERLMKEAEP